MIVGLEGKTLVVTGGTQGLGATIAALAAASGAAAIAIVGRNAERGEAVSLQLTRPDCPVTFIRADLGEADAPAAVMATAIARLGRVDCLVNAAALTDRASLLTGTLDDWDRLFAVNARAPFFLMQAAVADMMARRAPGSIVNILSVNAHCGAPELAIYSATKGRAVDIDPKYRQRASRRPHPRQRHQYGLGGDTCRAADAGSYAGQRRGLGKAAAAGMPLGRLLTMEEVAQLTLFLLSDASGLMTGGADRSRANRAWGAAARPGLVGNFQQFIQMLPFLPHFVFGHAAGSLTRIAGCVDDHGKNRSEKWTPRIPARPPGRR